MYLVAFIPLHKLCDCFTAAPKHMETLFAWSFTETPSDCQDSAPQR